MSWTFTVPILLASIGATAFSDVLTSDEISALIEKGEYTQAIGALIEAASQVDSPNEQDRLRWEAERLRRIQLDYDLTQDDIMMKIHERIGPISEEEFNTWKVQGRFDWRLIDGEPRFISPSVVNLQFRYPDIHKRSLIPLKQALAGDVNEIVTGAYSDPIAPVAGARKYHIRMTLTVDADAVPAGETIRCWLPFPRECAFQKDVKLLSSQPKALHIAAADAPHRSVYFEREAVAGAETVFAMEYELIAIPRLDPIDPARVTSFSSRRSKALYDGRIPPSCFSPGI